MGDFTRTAAVNELAFSASQGRKCTDKTSTSIAVSSMACQKQEENVRDRSLTYSVPPQTNS